MDNQNINTTTPLRKLILWTVSLEIQQLKILAGQQTNSQSEQIIQSYDKQLTEAVDQIDKQLRQTGQTNTTPTNTSDFTVNTLQTNSTLDGEYRFRGLLSKTLYNQADHLTFNEVGSYFGSNVVHQLQLDYQCDGTVDDTVMFETPYYSILPRSNGADVLLSENVDLYEHTGYYELRHSVGGNVRMEEYEKIIVIDKN